MKIINLEIINMLKNLLNYNILMIIQINFRSFYYIYKYLDCNI